MIPQEIDRIEKAIRHIQTSADVDPWAAEIVVEAAIGYVKTIPSAQPEPQWIPCSERLPENDKSVLATTAWGEVTIAERIYPPINDTCWFIHDGNTNATIDDVIAWMPLPEPYEGGNDA